jgi:hypothetical protein
MTRLDFTLAMLGLALVAAGALATLDRAPPLPLVSTDTRHGGSA